MVSSLDDTLDNSFLLVKVIEYGNERPELEDVEDLNEAIKEEFGWAFRFGMGASDSLNDYRYGYIIGSQTLNPETIQRVEDKIEKKTGLRNPSVLMEPVNVPEHEFENMEKIGSLPSEKLSSLEDLVEKVEEEKD